MTPGHPVNPAAFPPLFVALIFAGLFVYGWLARRVAKEGGKVTSGRLGFSDLFLCTALFFWFGLLLTSAAGRVAPRVIHTRDVVHSAVMETLLVLVICGFLRYRHISLVELFGLRRMGLLRIPGLAILFLLSAYPLIGLATVISQHLTGGQGEPQEIVQFFLEAAKKSEHWAVAATIVMGVIVAPAAEELIFRGYIYGTLKRYLGIPAGLILNSAIFAAIHMDASALLPLFVLAVCFTLVYEATGSLLVSTTMHAFFNLVTFLALTVVSTHVPTK